MGWKGRVVTNFGRRGLEVAWIFRGEEDAAPKTQRTKNCHQIDRRKESLALSIFLGLSFILTVSVLYKFSKVVDISLHDVIMSNFRAHISLGTAALFS